MIKILIRLIASIALLFQAGYSRAQEFSILENKDSLLHISESLTTSSEYFDLFLNHPKKVNKVMGKNFAENKVMDAIYNDEIKPASKLGKVNWDSVERSVASRYGALGEERVWGIRTIYYNRIRDWEKFGKYYAKYFSAAIPKGRTILVINNVSWDVFEHVSDRKILKVAVKAMKFGIDNFYQDDHLALDTYANLLYKLGRVKEAIKCEEKVVHLSNDADKFVNVLNKMKQGEKTWAE